MNQSIRPRVKENEALLELLNENHCGFMSDWFYISSEDNLSLVLEYIETLPHRPVQVLNEEQVLYKVHNKMFIIRGMIDIVLLAL